MDKDADTEIDLVDDDSRDLTETDPSPDGSDGIDADMDPGLDENDPVDAPAEDVSVDQLPWDCFTPIDAPGDLIPPDWEPVLPDREPTPCDGCCRQVTISPYDNTEMYDIWGRYIVSFIELLGGPDNSIDQIRLKDVERNEEYIIREERLDISRNNILGNPAIYENVIVYPYSYKVSEETARCEIIKLSLPSGIEETVYSFDVPVRGWCPGQAETVDMFGDYVVYGANKVGDAGMQQIFLLNLETGNEVQISEGPCCTHMPRMWGDRAVYLGWYTYSEEIYMYDIASGTTTNVTNDDFDGRRDQRMPAIWQDLVVYVDGPYFDTEQNADIVLKDLATGEITTACGHPAAQGWPDVFGDLVAWLDYRSDPCPNIECRTTNTDIYYYWISTGTEHRLTAGSGMEGRPRIWENRIFFRMRDSADILSIFMKEAE